MVCVTHGVLLLCISKYTLNCFFSLGIDCLALFSFADGLHNIQILLPDMRGHHLLPLFVGSAFEFAWARLALGRNRAVSSLSFLVCCSVSQHTTLRANETVRYRIVLILPGLVPFFISLTSGIGHDGYSPILQNLLCNPRGFICCVHRHILQTFKSTRYIVIYCIPGYAVMNIPCRYFYSKNKPPLVAGCVLRMQTAVHVRP